MRAAFIHGIRDVRVGELPDAQPTETELLLKVSSVGICGSDLHYYLEGGIGRDRIRQPYVPGHEFCARVVDDRAEKFGLKKGQMVAVDPARPCYHCENCLAGHHNLCLNMVFRGAAPNTGAFTQYVTAPPTALFPIPDGISSEEVTMMEPLGIALATMDLGKIRLLEDVCVLGCGPIGLCIVQLAKLCGADHVYAIDPIPYRAEAARKLGADKAGGDHRQVMEWTGGRGVDICIEITDNGASFEQAGDVIRLGGRIILGGIPEGGRYTTESFDLRRKGATVKLVRRMGHVYPRCIRLVESKRIDIASIVTHKWELDDVKTAFDLQASRTDGVQKGVVFPNGMSYA